ncbi:MAG: cytochrome P450 [Candidatus Rokuibacteriota bacterium]|nr:MAG: cytochrome P450 [Candidatus Rokubacteria bacterium]
MDYASVTMAATGTATPADVPGPRLPRSLQSLIGVIRPFDSRIALRNRFGPVFATNDVIVGRMFHIADRALIEQMFKWKPAQYNVGEPRQVMEPVTGPSSILLLDGARHMRMRKLMLPPFHGEAIARYADLIEQITNREIDGWRAGQSIRTRSVGQTITMEVIIRAVFGITDPARVAELRRVLPRLSSINPILGIEAVRKDLGPHSPWGRFVRDRDRADELIYEEIDQRRRDSNGAVRDDILSLLLSARDEHGDPLTDRELRDELITILLAGHETTATSIGWAFERLLRNPAALQRLTAEVKAGEGDYMDAVIKETLRVRPVVTEVFRAPAEAVELGGYRFDPGVQMAASILLVQYDPELYPPDPHAFRPERFLDGAPEPYTWVPFGGGVRRCLGAAFAQLEMKIVIAAILRRARLRAPRARGERPRFRGVTVLPSRGGEAVVERVAS